MRQLVPPTGRRSSPLYFLVPLMLLALVVAYASPGPHSAPGEADLAFVHVAVVDVESGRILPDQTVLISGNRIVQVIPSRTNQRPAATQVVDGTGKYLIPGLWDMHVHTSRSGRAPHFWPLFLAHGVTGVREMGSYLDSLRYWRAEAERPGSGAPRIHWSSPMLDGVPATYENSYPVPDADAARMTVDTMQQLGFDFLKVYDRLSRETYFALAAEANRRGIPFAGHSHAVSAIEASDAGQKSIEHPRDLFIACMPQGTELWAAFVEARSNFGAEADATRQAMGRLWMVLAMGKPDPALCRPLFERLVANGTWVTPTLTMMRGEMTPTSQEADPRLRFVPPALAEAWRVKRRLGPAEEIQLGQPILENSLRLVGLAHHAGVGLLAGTDSSGMPYVFAGSSLHDELALLVEAGLTPLEALRTATVNPAKYLGATDSLGTVSPGKLADLVLLDANPLEDIRNTMKISAVVANGRLIDAAERERLLRKAEEEAARATIEIER